LRSTCDSYGYTWEPETGEVEKERKLTALGSLGREGGKSEGLLCSLGEMAEAVERERSVRSISPYLGCVLCFGFRFGAGFIEKVLLVGRKSRNLRQFMDKRN